MAQYPWQVNRNPLALSAGQLRHEIRIQKQDTTTDEAGGDSTTWVTVLAALAGIETLSLREVYQSAQFASQVTHRITMRYPGEVGIGPGMQVLFGTKRYLIQGIDNVQERNRVLLLTVQEINGKLGGSGEC